MSKFHYGHVVATQGVLSAFAPQQLLPYLARHLSGDWGEVCAEDKASNDVALQVGTRLLSSYTVASQVVWIITEADRSVTTILLPEEY